MTSPVTVAVTGAAGQICYNLLFRLASGETFGDRPVHLKLLDLPIPAVQKAAEGVAMEIMDCGYKTLAGITVTGDPNVAFDGVNWALLVGAKPRGPGMLRKDLILENGPIFTTQGEALARGASDMRTLVVGNPCNTNALIAASNCAGVPTDRFTAMTRLDQNRAVAQLAMKAGVTNAAISHVTIWGNHSATQYPDFENARINGAPVTDVITDVEWLRNDFIKTVQQRGKAIVKPRQVQRRLGGQRGDRPREVFREQDRGGRLVQRGRGLRRQLRRARGAHLLLPGDQRWRRRLLDRPGPRDERLGEGPPAGHSQ